MRQHPRGLLSKLPLSRWKQAQRQLVKARCEVFFAQCKLSEAQRSLDRQLKNLLYEVSPTGEQ